MTSVLSMCQSFRTWKHTGALTASDLWSRQNQVNLVLQVPTVNVTDMSSLENVANRFADLMDLSSSRRHIIGYMTRPPSGKRSAASAALPPASTPLKLCKASSGIEHERECSFASCQTPDPGGCLTSATSGHFDGRSADSITQQAALLFDAGLYERVQDVCDEFDLLDSQELFADVAVLDQIA
jgi:hypothetical protein